MLIDGLNTGEMASRLRGSYISKQESEALVVSSKRHHQSSRHRIPVKQPRSNSSPRTNISKAAEIRNFVSNLKPVVDESLSPS